MEKTAFDFAALDTVRGANEGFDLEILDPATNEETGLTLHIIGKDSDEFQKISHAQSKKRLDRNAKGGFRNVASVSIEEIERDNIDLLSSCVKSWRQRERIEGAKPGEPKWSDPKPTVTFGGKELPCTKENIAAVWERLPWMKDQVDSAIGDRANFIKR